MKTHQFAVNTAQHNIPKNDKAVDELMMHAI